MADEAVATFKVLIIGDSNCGKSSLLMAFTEGTFDESIGPTIGVDFKQKSLMLDGNKVNLTLWDTAGQERFRTLTASYYRGAHAVILLYDVSRPETFEHIDMWLNEVNVYCPEKKIVKLLIANKIDLERRVSTEVGRDFARDKQMMFIECSAKTKAGVQQAFEELAQKVLDTPELWNKEAVKGLDIRGGKGGATDDPCSACSVL
ncbi:uncharacterized protein MONBRDRAFT_35113 [Monosiga brevicollis MX1]|uniref:Uncharacterized protein n=1 Tax=Monosiga brevicollis TaxID=81824 RepID=A9UX66_MONBE|nr:uncharacterized protein MONBRDRAFT_35113 [Monosiga brevicollis MX1]EDQ90337.1 predicted protein [Monosiga brevicollis MX1]|eukprot:XP_001745104.1 hypothetical protein [Monosiga brevicollis MX1]